MRKILSVLGLLTIAAIGVSAQKAKVSGATAVSSATNASVNKAASGATTSISSGTQISGELQNALDAKNARVGDQVVLKTASTIKQNGQVVVQKGSKLIGHVTAVQQRTKDNAASKVSVLFDTLQQGSSSIPINGVITSIVQARAATTAAVDDDMSMGSTGMASTTTSSSAKSSNGGLLGGVGNTVGGVTNTVGGVVNTTTNTVGGVTNTAGQTLGSTTSAVGGTVRGLQISQSTDASASGGSTLSLNGGNLKLEKGAMVNVRVTEATSAKAN